MCSVLFVMFSFVFLTDRVESDSCSFIVCVCVKEEGSWAVLRILDIWSLRSLLSSPLAAVCSDSPPCACFCVVSIFEQFRELERATSTFSRLTIPSSCALGASFCASGWKRLDNLPLVTLPFLDILRMVLFLSKCPLLIIAVPRAEPSGPTLCLFWESTPCFILPLSDFCGTTVCSTLPLLWESKPWLTLFLSVFCATAGCSFCGRENSSNLLANVEINPLKDIIPPLAAVGISPCNFCAGALCSSLITLLALS